MARILNERIIEKNKIINLCFIDYTKAFDRVRHDKLIEIMKRTGIPNHEIRLIANLYWKQKASVRPNQGESEEIEIKRGIRQGCTLSPILFNLYSEFLIEEALSNRNGRNINRENINNIRFADDTVLIAESKEDLQEMINELDQKCTEYGMRLNAKENKSNGNRQEGTNCGKNNGKCEEEVRRRIGKAKSNFGNLRNF